MTKNEKEFIKHFIKREMQKFKEPREREGTPRGEPLGPSRIKYKASLYCAVGYSLKYVSMKLNISYGSLRNWTSKDPRFIKLINEKRDRFFDRIPKINLAVRLEEIINDMPIGKSKKEEAMSYLMQLVRK